MRKILILSLISFNLYAEGKISLRAPFHSSIDKYQPEAGLYINENVSTKFFYQSWTGGRTKSWFNSSHDIMYRVNDRASVGVGPSYYRSKDYDNNQNQELRGSVTLEYKLWD